jgi:hypothetical protein
MLEGVFRVVDGLVSLDAFSKGKIEQALATELRHQPQANRYVSVYGGQFESGPFTSAEYTAPRPGCTSNVRRLKLMVRPGLQVTRQQMSTRYGSGIIGGITPTRGLHGTVTYEHEAGGKALYFTYDGRSYELLDVTLHSAEPIEEGELVEGRRPWWKFW